YVNDGVINAIRVKLFSMTEEWDNVLTYGESIMSKYTIALPKYYSGLFSKTPEVNQTQEVIFRYNVTVNSGPSVVGTWYSVRANGQSGSFFYEMGRSLYNEL